MLFSVILGLIVGIGLYLYKRKVDKESEEVFNDLHEDLNLDIMKKLEEKIKLENKTFRVYLLGNDSFTLTGHPSDILNRQFFKDPTTNKLYNTNQVKYLEELNGQPKP
jgi:hypothetical protein